MSKGELGARPKEFLTAEWKNLVMLNYAVDPRLLEPFVPAGTELDSFDGKTYASLVGFEFNRIRVLGVPIPFHRSFEEVNLRFYVRRGSKRGVVFISELVPKRAVAAVARLAFNEKYSYVPMDHRVTVDAAGDVIDARYSFGTGARRCELWIETKGPGEFAAEGSLSQFITEHYWGYAAQAEGGRMEYEVQHPSWLVKGAARAGYSGGLAGYYGAEMASALAGEPASAFLAEGSAVTVFQGARIG